MTAVNLVPNIYVNLAQEGPDPTGITDSTLAFARAFTKIANISNQGRRGTLYIPYGFYVTDGFDLPGQFGITTNFEILGGGEHNTFWQLKNGANKSLISAYTSSINNLATYGAAPSTSLTNFTIRHLSLSGNRFNQSSGPSYPLQIYAHGYELENMGIYDGFSGGIQADYHNIFVEPLETHFRSLRVGYNNDIGIKWYGPSDSMWAQVLSYENGSHNLHVTNNATGLQDVGSHYWFPGQGNNSVCGLIEGAVSFVGCEFEGSDTVQMVLNTQNISFYGGSLFGGGHNGTALQIGTSGGLTPYNGSVYQSGGLTQYTNPNGYIVDTFFSNVVNNSNGNIWFGNDGVGTIRGFVQAFGSTTPVITGTPNAATAIDLQVWDGNGQYTIKKVPTGITIGNASTLRSGTGVPASGLGSNGDFFLRQDGGGAGATHLYFKNAGAWIGVA